MITPATQSVMAFERVLGHTTLREKLSSLVWLLTGVSLESFTVVAASQNAVQ